MVRRITSEPLYQWGKVTSKVVVKLYMVSRLLRVMEDKQILLLFKEPNAQLNFAMVKSYLTQNVYMTMPILIFLLRYQLGTILYRIQDWNLIPVL